MAVAAQFLQDFEKSGIHLPDRQRARFVSLSDEIITLGRVFTTPASSPVGASLNSDEPGRSVEITYEELVQWNAGAMRGTSLARGEKLYLHPDSLEGQAIRREHPDAAVRKRFYLASFDSSGEKVGVLEQLLKRRGELAQLVGRKSWADVALLDKMAKNPGEQKAFSMPLHFLPLTRMRAYRQRAILLALSNEAKSIACGQ